MDQLVAELMAIRNQLLPLVGRFPRLQVASEEGRNHKAGLYAYLFEGIDRIDEWLDELDPDWRSKNVLIIE